MADMFDLQRFVAAQEGIYDRAVAELSAGRKQSHWMWFIFPQLAGLGRSATARHFGIASAAEARAYLAHPSLGTRLMECTRAVLKHPELSLQEMFGTVDALKFRSSMTLFGAVSEEDVFERALEVFARGEQDPATLALLD